MQSHLFLDKYRYKVFIYLLGSHGLEQMEEVDGLVLISSIKEMKICIRIASSCGNSSKLISFINNLLCPIN